MKKDKTAKRLLQKAEEALKEQPETKEETEKEGPAADPKLKTGLSEKRKRALINYMAILLAVAFLLVALSLGIQYRDSQATISQLGASATSAMEKADKLQEDNRLLQEELDAMRVDSAAAQEELDALRDALTEAQTNEDVLAGANQELLEEKLSSDDRAEAYRLLTQALRAQAAGDRNALGAALTELADLVSKLDPGDRALVTELTRIWKTQNQTE